MSDIRIGIIGTGVTAGTHTVILQQNGAVRLGPAYDVQKDRGERFAAEFRMQALSSADTTWIFPFERVGIYGDHSSIVSDELEAVSFCMDLNTPVAKLTFSTLPVDEVGAINNTA